MVDFNYLSLNWWVLPGFRTNPSTRRIHRSPLPDRLLILPIPTGWTATFFHRHGRFPIYPMTSWYKLDVVCLNTKNPTWNTVEFTIGNYRKTSTCFFVQMSLPRCSMQGIFTYEFTINFQAKCSEKYSNPMEHLGLWIYQVCFTSQCVCMFFDICDLPG